jgi:hypothetical protein
LIESQPMDLVKAGYKATDSNIKSAKNPTGFVLRHQKRIKRNKNLISALYCF